MYGVPRVFQVMAFGYAVPYGEHHDKRHDGQSPVPYIAAERPPALAENTGHHILIWLYRKIIDENGNRPGDDDGQRQGKRVPYDTQVFGICHLGPIQDAAFFRVKLSNRPHNNPPKSPHFALTAIYIFYHATSFHPSAVYDAVTLFHLYLSFIFPADLGGSRPVAETVTRAYNQQLLSLPVDRAAGRKSR
jgi:hypothetical protein